MWGLSRCRLRCIYGGVGSQWGGYRAGTELKRHLLGQLQRDHTPGLSFYTLPPEFEFGVNGAVEHKVLLEALGLKGTDGGVMADLLRHPPEAQIFSAIGDKFGCTADG